MNDQKLCPILIIHESYSTVVFILCLNYLFDYTVNTNLKKKENYDTPCVNFFKTQIRRYVFNVMCTGTPKNYVFIMAPTVKGSIIDNIGHHNRKPCFDSIIL